MHPDFIIEGLKAHAKMNDVGTPSSAPSVMPMQWKSDIKRILCIRLDNMGDVLMTSPAIAALKHGHADRHISLLTSSSAAPIASFIPEIDEVITFDPPWAKHAQMADAPACQALVDLLAAKHFDAAVIFTVYSQSPLPAALVCFLAGIPNRLAHCRENPYSLLTAWVAEKEPETLVRHEVQRQLDLVRTVQRERPIGSRDDDAVVERMRFVLQPGDRAERAATLASAGVAETSPYIVMHPGSTAASRRYPADRFAQVASQLARRTGMNVILTGTGSEENVLKAMCSLAQNPLVTTLRTNLSLGAFGSVLETASLLISNNTGPVHMAAALQTPVVDIYALTNPQHTPWGTRHRVLFQDVPCRWCYKSVCPQLHHQCLEGVSVDTVVDAALSLLHETGTDPTSRVTESAPLGKAPCALRLI